MRPRLSGSLTHLLSTVAVQNYITAILIFLVVEMLITWGYYGLFSLQSSEWYGYECSC
jgi:hypothetical protein